MSAPSGSAIVEPKPCLLFEVLDDDCLMHIVGQLPLSSLVVSLAPTCRRLAALAEPTFRAECARQGWRVQRRMRDHPFAWRLLLRQRSCTVCLGPEARFPVRRGGSGASGGGAPVFRLCRACARREKVQQQVQRHGLEVDAIGEDGKALFARQFHIPLFGHANGFATSLTSQINTTGI